MKQYYRKSNLKNRLILTVFLVIAIFLMTVYYRNPDTSVLQLVKRGAVNVIAYVQVGSKNVLSPVYNGWIFILELKDAKNQNMVLREELTGLKDRLNDLRVIQEENTRLRKLVKVDALSDFNTVMAYPVGTSSNNYESSVIIDKGSRDGIKNRMPVFDKDGLVGQVVNAAMFASQVQLISDNRSGVAAEIVGRGDKGLVHGTFDNVLKMTLVKKTAKIKIGDMVVTSGLGGVYPRNLYIGRVRSAKSSPQALYKDIEIGSEVDFNNLGEVMVIKSPLPPKVDEFK